MKRQSLGALLLATSLLTVGYVSSCKDNDSDSLTELDYELSQQQKSLQENLESQIRDLNQTIEELKGKKECACDISAMWDSLMSNSSQSVVQTITSNPNFTESVTTAVKNSLPNQFQELWEETYANTYVTSEALQDAISEATASSEFADSLLNLIQINANDIVELNKQIESVNGKIDVAKQAADSAQVSANRALTKAETALKKAEEAGTVAQNALDSVRIVLKLAQDNAETLGTLSSSLQTLTNRVDVIDERLGQVADSATSAYNKAYELDTKFQALQTSVDSLGGVVDAFGNKLNAVGLKVDAISDDVKSLGLSVDSLGNVVTAHGEKITALQYSVDSLGRITTALDAALKDSIAQLRQEAAANLQKAYDYAKDQDDTLRVQLTTKIVDLKNELSPLIQANTDSINALKAVVADNTRDINSLSKSVAQLTADFNNLKLDVSNLITGIIIQGTDDPVFGYLALPFGIQTNILAAYYGNLSKNVKFPNKLSAAEESRLGLEKAQYEGGSVLISDAEGNAGKIYLTINPTNIDFTGQTFNLVLENSRGEESKIVLKNVRKSDALLTFGVTRAGNNGFYEADAYLAADDAAAVAPSVDLSDFKTVAKDLLNNHTFDISTAVSAVYNAVNCKLPRYAAKTYWTNSEGKEVAVYSNYAIAATSLKPLSFNFLKDYNVSSRTISRIDPSVFTSAIDKMTDSIKIELSFDELNLGLDSLNIDFNVEVPSLSLEIKWENIDFSDLGDTIFVPYYYEVPQYDVDVQYDYDEFGNKTDIKSIDLVELDSRTDSTIIPVTGMADIYTNIAKQVNSRMDSVMKTINAFSDDLGSFTDQMQDAIDQLKKLQDFTTKITGLQEQINSVLSSVNASLDTQVSKLVNNIKDNLSSTISGYVGTINNYIDKVNTVLNRVTTAVNNLNSKLQPALLYKTTSGSIAVVSRSKALPTQVTVSGGNAMELIPTTYSAEVLAPAYKKFVAVTNVYNGNKNADNDATCKAALEEANAVEFFNTVIDGNQRTVAFKSDAKYKGYIYQVAYTAVDYSGVESLQYFYIQIR
jgi:archaellum component FlaC